MIKSGFGAAIASNSWLLAYRIRPGTKWQCSAAWYQSSGRQTWICSAKSLVPTTGTAAAIRSSSAAVIQVL